MPALRSRMVSPESRASKGVRPMQVALLEPAAAAAEGTKEMNRRETSGSIDRVKEMLQIEFHCPNRSGDPSHRFKKHYLKDLLEGFCTCGGDEIKTTSNEMLR